MGADALLRKYLALDGGSEMLGEMVEMAAEMLMDAEVDQACGAAYGEHSDTGVNSRKGHRRRRQDTQEGMITLDVPKLRRGSSFPRLLGPRRRARQALVIVGHPPTGRMPGIGGPVLPVVATRGVVVVAAGMTPVEGAAWQVVDVAGGGVEVGLGVDGPVGARRQPAAHEPVEVLVDGTLPGG